MSYIVSNILTIIGTDEQVAQVRNFIKGSNGESISFQSIIPMPEVIRQGCDFDRFDWCFNNWGSRGDAYKIRDKASNQIFFETKTNTPDQAMVHLSEAFPAVSFHIVFADESVGQYCGEYTVFGGAMSEWTCLENDSDEAMEYYFRTHEYAREEWKKTEDGEWRWIYDEDSEEE